MVENEEANIPIYSRLYCVSTSGKRTSKSKKTFTVVINTVARERRRGDRPPSNVWGDIDLW